MLKKVIKGTETSLLVGLAAAALATLLGTLFGALAGYYGALGRRFLQLALQRLHLDSRICCWCSRSPRCSNQKGTLTVILILGLTGWTGIFRLVRAEYLKHKVREYVLAADAIGASDARRMFAHILPNVSHVVLVQLSLHVVLFIKSEVILSFLGFGVGVDTVSWGSMLTEAQSELILGMWWQLAAATPPWRCSSPRSACSPTRCATRSIRGCNERPQRPRPARRLQARPRPSGASASTSRSTARLPWSASPAAASR